MNDSFDLEPGCFSRRQLLAAGAALTLPWLTPVANRLARAAERTRAPAQSIIILWLAGGPSQLDTFDPHPRTVFSGDTKAIDTSVKGIQLAEHFPHLAEQIEHVALVRSLVSKEGDHERGTYLVKTGYRPETTIVHPTLGAIVCHELPIGGTEIPRHVSILPNQWPGHGGFLGTQYDAFKTYDPIAKVPDIAAQVSDERFKARLNDLSVVEHAFARGRQAKADATLHRLSIERARQMMTSEQLKAFEVAAEPKAVRAMYGDTPFGRGCLAARRLIACGVRCVEVTLDGWDSHAKNHEIQRNQSKVLDPAFAALIKDLKDHDLFDSTVVMCGGEFGRTPKINGLGGRDHWPTGFSMALAGGGLRTGFALGETDPEGSHKVPEPCQVADVHATVLTALGINPAHEEISPIGRPIKFCEGKPIAKLLSV